MSKKILIIGASGTGTTTIGKLLAQTIQVSHIDLDDIFWLPTEIPFTTFRANTEIQDIIEKKLKPLNGWIISGDPSNWEVDHIMESLDLVVFLSLRTEIRIQRIIERESLRFGADISEGGRFYETHQKFIEWTAKYDFGGINGRTRYKQETWLNSLGSTVLKLDASLSIKKTVASILAFMNEVT